MDEKFNELGYKNHDPFFYNLNKNFQTLMEIVSISRKDITLLEELYIGIDTFYVFYCSYIEKNKIEIEKKLNELQNFVYSNKFNHFIASKKTTKDFYSECSNMLLKSINVIPMIMSELHNNELFPKTIKVDNSIPSVARGVK